MLEKYKKRKNTRHVVGEGKAGVKRGAIGHQLELNPESLAFPKLWCAISQTCNMRFEKKMIMPGEEMGVGFEASRQRKGKSLCLRPGACFSQAWGCWWYSGKGKKTTWSLAFILPPSGSVHRQFCMEKGRRKRKAGPSFNHSKPDSRCHNSSCQEWRERKSIRV